MKKLYTVNTMTECMRYGNVRVLGLKCRHKWHRRRGWHTHGTHPTDEVYNALYAQCYKYHNLLEYLKRDEMLLFPKTSPSASA